MFICIVPDIPVSVAKIVALSAPYHPYAVHVHADVELQHLRDRDVRHIEVYVVNEVIQGRQERVIGIS